MVGDHGDEFTVGGFSLDAADGVAEELLQGLHAWIYCLIHSYGHAVFIGLIDMLSLPQKSVNLQGYEHQKHEFIGPENTN